MKRLLLFCLFVVLAPAAAHASTCSVPNVFSNGSTADGTQVNANFSALVSCGNTIDNTNIGANGIYASQIKPTTGAQATFGGTLAYTFSNGLTVTGGLTSSGSYVMPLFTSAGLAVASTAHAVQITGKFPVGACAPAYCCGDYNGYCVQVTLSGSATFASGGSSSTSPSFSCGKAFVYDSAGNVMTSGPVGQGLAAGETGISFVAGTPNTLYIAGPAASAPFTITCIGT